jgi:hypothetical protein
LTSRKSIRQWFIIRYKNTGDQKETIHHKAIDGERTQLETHYFMIGHKYHIKKNEKKNKKLKNEENHCIETEATIMI